MTHHTNAIKIYVAEDHALVRQGLLDMLAEHDDLKVVGATGDGVEALKAVLALHPDIALLDINLPGKSGLEIAEAINKSCPETRVIMLSGYLDDSYKVRALLAGAWDYVTKTENPERLINTIHDVHRRTENPMILAARKAIDQFPDAGLKASLSVGLTLAEIQVLEEIKDGKELKDAAVNLKLNLKTLQFHLSNIYQKLHVSNRNEAVYKALKLSIISID